MRTDLLDYDLPPDKIAQRPAEQREMARLMVLGEGSELFDRTIVDWPSLVAPGSLVVLNDTKVVRARLLGRKAKTGGKAELLLIECRERLSDGERWLAVGKGLRGLVGAELVFGDGALTAVVEGSTGDEGLFEVRLSASSGSVERALAAHGQMPIPPYIRRPADGSDAERYQTVYARAPGAIAAPTAGLHLTESLLDELGRRGVRIATLTLHVGLGTFQPVVAVGTTVVRALESAADPERRGFIVRREGETRMLIQPGHAFRVVDALLTNFHLPRSTLLALVAAFAGRERILAAYRAAVARDYRFFSYGDAMWIGARGAP